MSGFLERLRVRPDRRKVYDLDDSDDDVFVSRKIQTAEQVNPLAELERILDYEMRCTLTNQTDSDNVAPEQVFVKQYLVKWKGLSYLHCSWVPEQEFEKAYKFNLRLRTSMNKFHSRMDGIRNNGDDFVAIRPEWTTVDRIIASRGEEDGKKYLVKFKELSYDECCWESESDISTFQNEIQRFKDINSGSRRDKYVENEINRKEFKQLDHTPDFLKGSLHPYQLEGLNFLRFSWSKRTHVILADEMGLGKTIQSIAFLASLFEENLAPHLVVVPLSTLRNWEKEFGTWAPHMNVVVYGGNSKARTVIREHEFYFKKMKSGQISGEKKQDRIKFDVLLTSYEMINIDIAVLKSIKWKCLIVDEGHRLKNKDSRLFSSLKQYKSKHRVLLTGTPLQNNLDELFVLMHFLDVGKFGSLEEFQEEFKDINQEEQISRLHKMLSPHMLRRINTDVLKDTPPKKELILRVDLSSQQKQMYKAIITGNYQILAEKRGVRISSVLMELRKVCLHPYMVEGITPYIQDADAAHRKLLESSGKLQLLDKLMVKLKEQGHRVLVYTHFKHMLDLLEDYCTYKNWFYERLDGKVGGAERQIRIDRFNAKSSNRFCFLLSTRSGGLGINLATADTVIIYDSDWNPHADLQAMARAYRLGQTNKVMIYRLINRGTVEEKMMEMAKKKMLLEHLVVGKLKEQNLNQDELDDIIRYGSKELFCEETEEAGKIHYDDAAIEHLLDRNLVDSEEVSVDGKDENGFLKAFKVANFEYIDENDAAASVKAQAIENKSSASNSDRAKFWEELLKDKYEVHQSEKLNTLGKRKRKRNRKQMFEEYDLAGLEVSSDDETEPTNEQEPGQGNQTGKRPYRRKNRERSLSVLGFEKNERKVFLQTIMRYGVGNYDWKDFIKPLEQKTYEEIKDYGVLFLKHLIEDTEDSAPDYSDGVPKEGLKRDEVLARISLLMLVKEKSKFVEDHPTKPIFPNRILQRFPGLQSGNPWKEEHDKILLHGVSKHGFGKWVTILEDKKLGIKKLICEELNFPYTVMSAAEQASLPESSLNQKSDTPGNNNASANAGKKKTIIPYRDIMRKLGDFVRRRFSVLELALKYECAEEYYRQNSSSLTLTEQPETETLVTDTVGTVAIETGQEMLDELPQAKLITQGEISASVVDNKQERLEMAQLCNQTCGNLEENSRESVETYLNGQPLSRKLGENLSPMESISENISRSLSVVGTEHDDVEMKDSEEKAEEDVDVKLKAAETDHVIVLD